MGVALALIKLSFIIVVNLREHFAIPPDACFSQFKWQDCGRPPKAVVYYYKSGSRCEVGYWRGCYPNPNMFVDEYECVQTCIFSIRARDEDFHNLQKENMVDTEDYILSTNEPDDGSTNDGSTVEPSSVPDSDVSEPGSNGTDEGVTEGGDGDGATLSTVAASEASGSPSPDDGASTISTTENEV